MDGILVFNLSQEFKINLNNIFIQMRNYGNELYLGGFVKRIGKGFFLIQDHPFIYPIFIEETNKLCRRIIIDKYIIVYMVMKQEKVISVTNIYHHTQNYYNFYRKG